MKNNSKIDVVVTWVDENDQQWAAEKNKYLGNSTDGLRRNAYRDWGTFKYWFRCIETNMPWVNKIFFVTYGHVPEWLNVDNPKIVIVKHEDFIPEKYLPVFSSHPIELNLHRIKGLSENFVYLNDDEYVTGKVKPTDFFRNGKPVDSAVLTVTCEKLTHGIQKINNNNIGVINQEFSFKNTIKKHWSKWINTKYGRDLLRTLWLLPCPRFPGIKHNHLNSNLMKSTFEEVWRKYPEVLDRTCQHRFRIPNEDVNQWLFKDWQLVKGDFYPGRIKGTFRVIKNSSDIPKYIEAIKDRRQKIICLNDSMYIDCQEFEDVSKEVRKAFEKRFPKKSEYEK